MITKLANRTHNLYTAHIIVFNAEPEIKYEWVSKAEVTFGKIPIEVAEVFAKEEEPYRHSGAYELTAISGSFIKSIQGSHSCVQGLDIYELCTYIVEGSKKIGWIK
jgi:predicted house-cleaning NTP pyrophosphatase (Maf/HAM1 superfamily)